MKIWILNKIRKHVSRVIWLKREGKKFGFVFCGKFDEKLLLNTLAKLMKKTHYKVFREISAWRTKVKRSSWNGKFRISEYWVKSGFYHIEDEIRNLIGFMLIIKLKNSPECCWQVQAWNENWKSFSLGAVFKSKIWLQGKILGYRRLSNNLIACLIPH